MAGLLTSFIDALRSYTGSVAWAPLVQFSRSSILNLLKGIEIGQLTVREKDGSEIIYGKPGSGEDLWPVASLNILREAFWLRLALFADMVSWPAVCCSP
jgi:hypothetical protein